MFIADIGINHNGDINIALELIKKAKESGVDIIKFQKRNPDICIKEKDKYIMKDSVFGKIEYLQYKHMLEFGKKEYDIINSYCKKIGIQWTASVWDIDSLNFILNYDIPFIKIPSALIANDLLIKEIDRKTDLPIIFSIGGHTFNEIINCWNQLHNQKTILFCNSTYPTPNDILNLEYIKTLQSHFGKEHVGYSGHEEGYLPTLVAKSLGANIIERHVTLDRNMIGSDQKSSLDIIQLKELIVALRDIEICLGKNERIISEKEMEIIKKLRY